MFEKKTLKNVSSVVHSIINTQFCRRALWL